MCACTRCHKWRVARTPDASFAASAAGCFCWIRSAFWCKLHLPAAGVDALMGATKLLGRHRSHSISPFVPFQTPNSSPPSNFFHPFPLSVSGRCRRPWNPNPHLLFSNNISYRSFSWYTWSDTLKKSGDEGTIESSENWTKVSPLDDDSATISELSNIIEIDGSRLVEVAVCETENMWYLPLVRRVIYLFDGFHDLTGLPWWVVIFTSILALRAALLPILILQLKKLGEIGVLLPKLPPPFPPPLSGRSFQEQYLLFQNKRRELGCPSILWNFAFLTIQFPCFLLWMTSIRRMCLDHHPGFDNGGILWFQNLTEFPHGILGSTFPILIGGLHYINVQISFRGSKVINMKGIFGFLAKYYKLYLDVLAVPLVLIGFHVPQGSLVYWATNSLLTSVQILSLRNPYVRKKLGLPDEKVLTKKNYSIANVLCEPSRTSENKISTVMLSPKDSSTVEIPEDSSTSEHKISAETLSPKDLLDIGLKYFASGHLDEALPLIRLATEKDPGLSRALIGMGQIYCSKGSFEEAGEYFERAISKIQEEELGLLVLALYGAGCSRIWQGSKSEGIEHLKRIARLEEPEDSVNKACYYRGLVLLGSELFKDGDKSEAAKYLRKAAAYDPAVNAYVKECEE